MDNKLKNLKTRLSKINIDIEYLANYPWIYIDTINNKKVTEKFNGNHGFTIAFLPIKLGENLHFTDISEIFKLIRNYSC